MSQKPDVQITFISQNEYSLTAELYGPRKVTIKSGFGAQPRRAWIELYNEQVDAPIQLGDELRISINQAACFRGRIRQIRLDSQGDLLTLYALWSPAQEFDFLISKEIVGLTATETIEALIENTGLQYNPDPAHAKAFARLEFQQHPLFAAIDLLAKLAGNWRWDVDDGATLHFRPFGDLPDHVVYLAQDQFSIDLWRHDEEDLSSVEINAGVASGEELTVRVVPQEIANLSSVQRIYARPIVTQDALLALSSAITAQLGTPYYSHHVDWVGQGETVQPGDTVQFTFTEPLALFPHEQIFRVKQRDLTYAHETLTTRLHVTHRFESTNQYFDELKTNTHPTAQYMDSYVGAFQLDASSLDSESHLDAA